MRGRELERMLHDPVHTLVGVQLFLNRDFVLRARLEASADADVQPFRVLAEHDEVHVRHRPALQGAEPLVEQLDGPVVDVEIELEARAEKNVAGVPVVGNARVAQRADEDGVELVPQHRVAVRWNRDAGLQEIVRAPRERLEIEPAPEHVRHGAHGLDRLRSRLDANSVAGDDCYTHRVIG